MKIPADTVQCAFASPLGAMTLACTPEQLVGVWFADDAHLPDLSACPHSTAAGLLQRTSEQLAQYFAGQRSQFDLPLKLDSGTAFQNAVWQALLAIPAGSTRTYGDLARQLGKAKAVRAIGAAVGRNPLSIIVPCHRVIGADGSLVGYAGGLQRKTALLHLEGVL